MNEIKHEGEHESNTPHVVAESQVASDYVLEKPNSLGLDELVDHIAEHGANSVKAFIGVADVRQASLIKKDLLNDEDGDCFGELRARLHDAEAEGDDLSREEEMDDRVVVILLREGRGEGPELASGLRRMD